MLINVVDAGCGMGKTTSAINFMNQESKNGRKFLYITPYLNEVARIEQSCGFVQPPSYGNKLNGIKYLLEKGENIVSTHALFTSFNQEVMDLATMNNYSLIMDEVADVVQPFAISKYDLDTLLNKYTCIDKENSLLVWRDDVVGYTGRFEDYKRLCDLKCLSVYETEANKKILLLWAFPIEVFKAFKEIYVLTFMFDAQVQKYYYDYYGCEYKQWYIKQSNGEYQFTDEFQKYDLSYIRDLITFCESDKMNSIGDMDTSFSKTWFERHKNNNTMKLLKSNCENYYRNITKTPTDKNLWTTFKDYKDVVKGKGYTKGYASLNIRATNDYRERTAVAYLANRYFNPYVKNFFAVHNIEVNEDKFALSELIQFIWRSAIRDGKPITVYLPNKRTRTIFKTWLETL